MTIAEVVIHYVYLQGATEGWVREMSIRTKVQGGRFCLVFGWIDTLFTIVFRTRLVITSLVRNTMVKSVSIQPNTRQKRPPCTLVLMDISRTHPSVAP